MIEDTNPSLPNLADAIPAVSKLASPALRAAVLRTWTASLARSPYESLAASPQAPHMPARSLILHVNEVNQRAIELLRVATEEYGLKADAERV